MSPALKKRATQIDSVKLLRRKGAGAKARTSGTGVVFYCVHGHASTQVSKAMRKDWNPSRLIEALRVGLPFEELQALQSGLGLPIEALASMLGISKATLHRRRIQGALDSTESDRVVRFARLLGRAIEVLEDEQSAREWLQSPQIGLGGAIPLEYAKSEVGAREVENLLGRIEYGVYS